MRATITTETDTSRPGAEPGRPSRNGTKPEDERGEAERAAGTAASSPESFRLGVCIKRRDVVGLLDALTQQTPTFTQQRLDHVLRRHIEDAPVRAAFAETIRSHPATVALADDPDGRVNRYTTRRVLDEEQDGLAAAAALAGHRGHGVAAAGWARALGLDRFSQLSAEQEHAVAAVTSDTGLALVWGQAGTGKSFVLNVARGRYEAAGYRVIGLAPTNAVAADLRAAGFDRAATIHSELYALARGRQKWNSSTVIMVDEAAMIDTVLMGKLAHHAERAGAKLILAGDDRQFASIARGGLFSVLKKRYGAATLTEVRRQRHDDHRRASQVMAQGEFQAALNLYEGQGAISWTDSQAEAREAIIAAWAEDRAAHPEARQLVLAYTNDEVAKLNAALRAVCKRRGELGPDHMFTMDKDKVRLGFARGDRIQFTGTEKSRGILNGTAGRITDIHGNDILVRLDNGAELRFDATVFTKFQHGYASTLHRSQGRTFDRSYLLYSKHWRAAASYVAMTRHRDAMRLFVNRKIARDLQTLARQMKREEERRAASLFRPVAGGAGVDGCATAAAARDDDAPNRARSSFEDLPLSLASLFRGEQDESRRKERSRRDAGATETVFDTEAPGRRAAGEAVPAEAAFVWPDAVSPNAEPDREPATDFVSHDPAFAEARPHREPAAAPDAMSNTAGPVARDPAPPGPSAIRVKAQFRAAAKAASAPSPPEPKKKTRRRSEGDSLPRIIQPRPVVPAAYAALRTSTAKARCRTINLGSESPPERAGCFEISLCNQFGGGDYEAGFDPGFGDFSMPPEIGTNQNSPTL